MQPRFQVLPSFAPLASGGGKMRDHFQVRVRDVFHANHLSVPQLPGATIVALRDREKVSLRSKRFRRVWGQRKTEKRNFPCFSRAKNGSRAKTLKRRVGKGKEGNAFPSPSFAPFFAWAKRGKSRFSDFLCSPTPRKRSLRWLREGQNWRAPIELCILLSSKQDKKSTKWLFVLSIIALRTLNMYCDLCKTRKLRREFPLDTITEKCDHAPLHCLRVSIKLKERPKIASLKRYR